MCRLCQSRVPVAVLPCLHGLATQARQPFATVFVCASVCVFWGPQVKDPYWEDVSCYGYQSLQPHQDEIIKAAEQQLEKLRAAVKVPHKAGHSSAPKAGS